MLPNFIGIGPTKTATTWLFECLREHPQVFLPSAKETQFFARAQYTEDLREYEAYFDGAERFDAVGEISPRYFASPHAAERLHAVMPDVKLIVSFRHPVDRLESEYWHVRRMNVTAGDTSRNIPETIEAALKTHESWLIDPGLYATHLKRWFALYDRSQIHMIFGDDVKKRPQEVLRGVFEFIGVDGGFVPKSLTEEGGAVRGGVSPRSPMMDKIYTFIYTILVKGVYRPLRRLVGDRRAGSLKEALGARQIMSAVFHKKGYPKMDPKLRAELIARFEPEIRELEAMTGRDLSAWRK